MKALVSRHEVTPTGDLHSDRHRCGQRLHPRHTAGLHPCGVTAAGPACLGAGCADSAHRLRRPARSRMHVPDGGPTMLSARHHGPPTTSENPAPRPGSVRTDLYPHTVATTT